MKFVLPKLPYAFDALGECFNQHMLEVHYYKHHQGYIDKLNAALEGAPEWLNASLDDLVMYWEQLPVSIQQSVRNNAGGHWAHSFFWQCMTSQRQEPSSLFSAAIVRDFGSFAAFKELFLQHAGSFFGSGWTWLVVDIQGRLRIYSTPNHDVPQHLGMEPLLVVDLWEHAYYLAYENRRAEYLTAWWNVINWNFVDEQYQKASSRKDI